MISKDSNKVITLDIVLQDIWTMLRRGVEEPADAFHCPVLGTINSQGCSLRTVVLRRVLVAERKLLCHTDRRSRKIAEIAGCPQVSWLFYHPEAKVQLRISGTASAHAQDELADRQWAASKLMSRRCYIAAEPPGTITSEASSGLPETLAHRSPTVTESELGRQNFAVLVCQVTSIDWLYLSAGGHRRAHFSWDADKLQATWLIP